MRLVTSPRTSQMGITMNGEWSVDSTKQPVGEERECKALHGLSTEILEELARSRCRDREKRE